MNSKKNHEQQGEQHRKKSEEKEETKLVDLVGVNNLFLWVCLSGGIKIADHLKSRISSEEVYLG
jgi:hypothetical protein